MKTASEIWGDWVKNQPIDDIAVKRICKSIGEITGKSSTGARLCGVLAEASAIIQRQHMEIDRLKKQMEGET